MLRLPARVVTDGWRPRGAARGTAERPLPRRQLDGAPRGRGAGRAGGRTRRILARAAGTSGRGGPRAGGEPAGDGRDRRRGRARARGGAPRRPPRAGGAAPPRGGGGARPHRRPRPRGGGDRDPAGAVADRCVRPHPFGVGDRARGRPAHAAGARLLHRLRAVRGGPCVRRGSALLRARRRARRRRGRRAGTRARVALPDRRGHGLPRRRRLQQGRARFRSPRRRRGWAFEPSSRAR